VVKYFLKLLNKNSDCFELSEKQNVNEEKSNLTFGMVKSKIIKNQTKQD